MHPKGQPLLDFGQPFYEKSSSTSYDYGGYEEKGCEDCRFNLLCLEYGEYYLGDYAAIQHKLVDLEADLSNPMLHSRTSMDFSDSVSGSAVDRSSQGPTINSDIISTSNKQYSLSDIPEPKIRKTTRVTLEGRVRVASRSLVFEPDDISYPVTRYPYRYFEGELLSFNNTSLPSAINTTVGTDGAFAFHTSLFVEMKKDDIIAPFITKKQALSNMRINANHHSNGNGGNNDGIIYGDVELDQEFIFGLMHTSLAEFLPLIKNLIIIARENMDMGGGARYEEEELHKLTLKDRLNKAKIFDMSDLVDFNEKILLNVPVGADRITPLLRSPGCIMITNERLYFKPADVNNVRGQVLKYDLDKISWIFRRRFLLRQRGLEIFIASDAVVDEVKNQIEDEDEERGVCGGSGGEESPHNNLYNQNHRPKINLKKHHSSSSTHKQSSVKESLYLQFNSEGERNRIYNLLLQQASATNNSCLHRNIDLSTMTIMWQKREISNYDYLSYLNSYADRSTNDLTQYPVFPWVIADYSSKKLKLDDPLTFRDLSKPIGALNEERLMYLKERYTSMPPEDKEMGIPPPFLYGTHYSTPAYVLFYLVRSAPEYMLCLQSGRFDAPDRLFINIQDTWNSVLNNASDLKELIPEFYSPANNGAFLLNGDDLPFGTTQTGHKVDNVVLPSWAKSPQDFVKKCRKALESDYVSNHLHEWIDLIFGYKQRGIDAVENDNVFFHLTYEGAVDMEKIKDPLEKEALEVQIGEFGQCPRQLFLFPHPNRNDSPIERTSNVSINSRLRDSGSINNKVSNETDSTIDGTTILHMNREGGLLPSLKDANPLLNEAVQSSLNQINQNNQHEGTVRIGSRIESEEGYEEEGSDEEQNLSGGFLSRLGKRSSTLLGNISNRFRGNTLQEREGHDEDNNKKNTNTNNNSQNATQNYIMSSMHTTLDAIGENDEDTHNEVNAQNRPSSTSQKQGEYPRNDILKSDFLVSTNKPYQASIFNPNSPNRSLSSRDNTGISTTVSTASSSISSSPVSQKIVHNLESSSNEPVTYNRYISDDAVEELPENAKYGIVMISSETERIHADVVTSLQFIKNGKEFLSSSQDGSFRQHQLTVDVGGLGALDGEGEPSPLVSIRTKKRSQWIPTTGNALSSFALIHQDQLAVVTSWDFYMYIYSLVTGEQVGAIHGHNEAISVVEYPKSNPHSLPPQPSSPSLRTPSSSPTRSTQAQDTSPSLFKRMSTLAGFGTHQSGYDPATCYPHIFTGSRDGSVKMWELAASGLHPDSILECRDHDKPLSALSFNPEESLIAAGAEDGEVLIYDTRSGSLTSRLGKGQNNGWGGVVNLGWTKKKELLVGNLAGKLSLLSLDGNEMSSLIHTPPLPQRARSINLYHNRGNWGTPRGGGERNTVLSSSSPTYDSGPKVSPRVENRLTCMNMKPGGDAIVGGDALGAIKVWKNEYDTLKEWGCSNDAKNGFSSSSSNSGLSSPFTSSDGSRPETARISNELDEAPITAIEVEWGTGRMIVGDSEGRIRVLYMYQDY